MRYKKRWYQFYRLQFPQTWLNYLAVFIQLSTDPYEVAAYFESIYVGRHSISSFLEISGMFPIEVWNNGQLSHQGIHRRANTVEF